MEIYDHINEQIIASPGLSGGGGNDPQDPKDPPMPWYETFRDHDGDGLRSGWELVNGLDPYESEFPSWFRVHGLSAKSVDNLCNDTLSSETFYDSEDCIDSLSEEVIFQNRGPNLSSEQVLALKEAVETLLADSPETWGVIGREPNLLLDQVSPLKGAVEILSAYLPETWDITDTTPIDVYTYDIDVDANQYETTSAFYYPYLEGRVIFLGSRRVSDDSPLPVYVGGDKFGGRVFHEFQHMLGQIGSSESIELNTQLGDYTVTGLEHTVVNFEKEIEGGKVAYRSKALSELTATLTAFVMAEEDESLQNLFTIRSYSSFVPPVVKGYADILESYGGRLDINLFTSYLQEGLKDGEPVSFIDSLIDDTEGLNTDEQNSLREELEAHTITALIWPEMSLKIISKYK